MTELRCLCVSTGHYSIFSQHRSLKKLGKSSDRLSLFPQSDVYDGLRLRIQWALHHRSSPHKTAIALQREGIVDIPPIIEKVRYISLTHPTKSAIAFLLTKKRRRSPSSAIKARCQELPYDLPP
ncbi:hypothetical protein LAY41_19585 [Argonema galeatum A003/A1]|nr:hypothetical protein [Argonema galeatum A003/A1]